MSTPRHNLAVTKNNSFHEFVRSESANQQLSVRVERDVPQRYSKSMRLALSVLPTNCTFDSLLPVPGSDLGVTTVFT